MLNGGIQPTDDRIQGIMKELAGSIDTSQEAVAARLNLIMEAWGDSPTVFAAKIGVSPQVVANWRRTQSVPREAAIAILRVYGVSIDWLYVGLEHRLDGEPGRKIREALALRNKQSA